MGRVEYIQPRYEPSSVGVMRLLSVLSTALGACPLGAESSNRLSWGNLLSSIQDFHAARLTSVSSGGPEKDRSVTHPKMVPYSFMEDRVLEYSRIF